MRRTLLDKALVRPGRFERRVSVNPPDLAGRRRILDLWITSRPGPGTEVLVVLP